MSFAIRRIGYLCLSLWALACERTPEPKLDTASQHGATAPPQRPPARAASSASRTASQPYQWPAQPRLVAIGDVHGDLQALRAALRLAQAIDDQDRWIGKQLTVVQTGDQLDRGDQDRGVLDLLEKLEGAAKAQGSELHVLNGNHELMNAAFDFRYVTPHSFAEFQEFAGQAPLTGPIRELPAEARGRAWAFAPGGSYALKLARHATVAVIGDSLFAHAGVLPEHVEYGLGRINAEVRSFLEGTGALPELLQREDAPVWTRLYGSPELDASTCAVLERVLARVGARRLVVGHTVQKAGISSACSERVFRIDVGLSAYYGATVPQVLQITASGTRVLRATGATKHNAHADQVHSAP